MYSRYDLLENKIKKEKGRFGFAVLLVLTLTK